MSTRRIANSCLLFYSEDVGSTSTTPLTTILTPPASCLVERYTLYQTYYPTGSTIIGQWETMAAAYLDVDDNSLCYPAGWSVDVVYDWG